MKAYKLFRKRKDGTLGPLFINRTQVIPPNVWVDAEAHRTKGYAFRPGWHCCERPNAPHLKMLKDRVWCLVEINGWIPFPRPKAQGGTWYIASCLKVLKETKYAHRYKKQSRLGID